MTTEKPSISIEARMRLRSFVNEVEALQERWGVAIVAEMNEVVLRDTNRRTEFLEPDGMTYGEYDASIADTEKVGGFRLANLRIENFDGWGQ